MLSVANYFTVCFISECELISESVIFSRKKIGKKFECAILAEMDIKRKGDEYFKLMDSNNHVKAKKIARIYFRWPVFTDSHKNSNGATNWNISQDMAKQLKEMLKSPYTGRDPKCAMAKNVWEALEVISKSI